MNKKLLVSAAALSLTIMLVVVVQLYWRIAKRTNNGTDESAMASDSTQVVLIQAGKDNTIFAESNNSGGAAWTLFAGSNNRGDSRRALIWFDVSKSVPAGSRITSVALTLNLIGAAPTETLDREFSLHRLFSDWGEGRSGKGESARGRGAAPTSRGATWKYQFYDSDQWISAGGDFNERASATTSIGVASGSVNWTSTPPLVEDVQEWLDNPAANFGWAVVGPATERGTARRFQSRESADEVRPSLEVTFTPAS